MTIVGRRTGGTEGQGGRAQGAGGLVLVLEAGQHAVSLLQPPLLVQRQQRREPRYLDQTNNYLFQGSFFKSLSTISLAS